MHLAARPQQRVKIGSRDGGGKSYNLDVVTRVKQPSAARAHDAGNQYPLPVGRHARPRPENAIALRIRVLQAEPMDKFEDLVPRSARSGRLSAIDFVKGAKPGDLPVQARPGSKTAINLKTASVNLIVPRGLLVAADEAIELWLLSISSQASICFRSAAGPPLRREFGGEPYSSPMLPWIRSVP